MPKQMPDFFSLIYSKPLETFLAVCQQRSFTKAGEVLGISQSAVSQSILRLEETLGVTLFERHVRPIELTPEALILKEKIETHAAEFAGTISHIREENALRPIVRVAVIDSLSPNIAPALVHSLAQKSNRISILTGTSDHIIGCLMQHQVDVIVSSTPFLEIEGLSRYFLFQEPHVLILPKTLAKQKRKWAWEDLQYCGLPVIRYLGQTASGSTVEAFFRSMRMDFPLRFEADSNRVVFSLVAAGVGWSLTTPLCLLQCSDMISQIEILPAPKPAFSREIHVISRKGEKQGLAEEILRLCTAELNTSIIGQLEKIIPGCSPQLQIVEEGTRSRRAPFR
ncbi:LysR family transcriptional regulator [Xanthobacteraceae bacterium A53D]